MVYCVIVLSPLDAYFVIYKTEVCLPVPYRIYICECSSRLSTNIFISTTFYVLPAQNNLSVITFNNVCKINENLKNNENSLK